MTTTPDDALPDDHDRGDDAQPTAEPAGAEIGLTQGEGSTFEPEEDSDGHG